MRVQGQKCKARCKRSPQVKRERLWDAQVGEAGVIQPQALPATIGSRKEDLKLPIPSQGRLCPSALIFVGYRFLSAVSVTIIRMALRGGPAKCLRVGIAPSRTTSCSGLSPCLKINHRLLEHFHIIGELNDAVGSTSSNWGLEPLSWHNQRASMR